MRKPCLVCGVLTEASRCPVHRVPSRSYAEARRRAEAVRAWREARGDLCPGYGVPAHPSLDLTADHVLPRVDGGETGPLRVLCRSCNSRRGRGVGDQRE